MARREYEFDSQMNGRARFPYSFPELPVLCVIVLSLEQSSSSAVRNQRSPARAVLQPLHAPVRDAVNCVNINMFYCPMCKVFLGDVFTVPGD